MDFCKNCGAPVDDGQELCSACQAKQEASAENNDVKPEHDGLNEPSVQQPDADAASADLTQPEDGASSQRADLQPDQQKKHRSERSKRTASQLTMGALLVVAAIAVCLVVYFTQGRPHVEDTADPDASLSADADEQTTDTEGTTDTTEDGQTGTESVIEYPSYTWDPADVTDAQKYAVVATCAGKELTNQMLAYYYWYSYSSFLNAYYIYVYYYGLIDTTAPLDEQACYFDESMSWQEYFINNAVTSFAQFTLLGQRAQAENFTLPDETQEALDTLEQTLQSAAEEGGFASVDAYLQEYYGAMADYESYYEFMTDYYTALTYDDMVYNSFVYTDEEISDYYDENADALGVEKDDRLMVNVRHILIQPEAVEDVLDADGNVDEEATAAAEEAAMAAAREEIEALYDEWLSDEATEDSFGNLAYLNSDDAGSYANGGLYEEVYPGEMVEEFDAWCFDESRQPGDVEIVETSYGYHLIYFVSYCDTPYWVQVTQEAMLDEAYNTFFSELMEGDDSEIDLEQVVLLDPPGIYAAEEETDDTGDTDDAAGTDDTAADETAEAGATGETAEDETVDDPADDASTADGTRAE